MKTHRFKFLLFVLFPVLLTSAGEFLLKNTINHMPHAHVQHHAQDNNEVPDTWASELKATLSNPRTISALSLIVIGSLLWLIAMSKFELSFLYPFLSLNFLIIVAGSQLLLNETVSLYRYIAVLLIITGLIIISRSPYSEKEPES